MSWLTIVVISLGIAFLGVVLWLLRPRRGTAKAGQSPMDLQTERFLPRHYRYFPQVQQALSASDEEYLEREASRDVAQIAHRERRAVARQVHAALLGDFSDLELRAPALAALSAVL